MGVRVYSRGQDAEIEVSAEEAQRGLLAGEFDLRDDSVRVVREGNRTGTVRRQDIATAVSEGWSLADDEQVAAAKLRREESDFASQALGVVESGLAGATLGGSTWIESNLLGVDAERMEARQRGLGGIATAAEVAGGIAATVGTGGLGGVAGGAARGTALAARGSALARGASAAGRAVAAPARAVARVGAAAEAAVGGGIRGGLARGIIEGGAAGIGSTVHESVLGGQDITAERLVAGGVAGAAFGGVIGGGIPLGAKLLERGVRSSGKAMQSVLSRHTGQEVTSEVAEAAAKSGEGSLLASAAEKLAPIQGADVGAARRVYGLISSDSKRLHSILTRQKSIEAQMTKTIREDLTAVRTALEQGRIATQGASKYKRAAELVPRNADAISPRFAEKVRSSIADEIADMAATNERHFGQAFDVPTTLKAQRLVGRTFEEMAEGKTAGSAYQAMDRLKRDLGVLIGDTGGWGAPKPGMTAVTETNKRLRTMYGKVQKHLEREDVWGDAAVLQKEMNGTFGAARAAEAEFRKEGASGLAKLFSDTGEVNLRQAYNVARQYKRMGGEAVANKLDDVLEAQIQHLRIQKKHYELDAAQSKRIDDAETAIKRFRESMKKQSEDAAILDDLESLREAENARSVSMGAASTLGPAIGGTLGLSVGGLPGAAAGMVAGGIMRPYTSARHLAALGSLKGVTDGFAGKTASAITPMVNAIRGIGRGVAKGGKRVTRAAPATAARLGVSRRERAENLRRARDNAMYLATQPGALADAMARTTEVLSEVAPGVARSMGQITQRAALFLASKAPPAYKPPMSNRPPIVDPLAAAQYARFVEAVTDPVGALERLNRGRFTADHAEALRVVYPEIYADVQRQVSDAITETLAEGGTVPFSVRSRMAALFDAPVEPAMRPDRLPVIQASIAGTAEEAEEGVAGPEPQQMARASGASEMNPGRLMTPAQRVASGVARA